MEKKDSHHRYDCLGLLWFYQVCLNHVTQSFQDELRTIWSCSSKTAMASQPLEVKIRYSKKISNVGYTKTAYFSNNLEKIEYSLQYNYIIISTIMLLCHICSLSESSNLTILGLNWKKESWVTMALRHFRYSIWVVSYKGLGKIKDNK